MKGENEVLAKVVIVFRDGNQEATDNEVDKKVAKGTRHDWPWFCGLSQARLRFLVQLE